MNIRIALMSVADMHNYGDMLFPFVARNELSKRIPNAEFRFFTPTSQNIEGEQFHGYSRDALRSFNPNAILLVGGEVIHKYEIIWERAYAQITQPILTGKVSDTFFDWTDYPNAFKAWFSIGAIGLPPGEGESYITELDYVGVRGVLTKKILEDSVWLSNNHRIHMTPDVGWIFSRYMSYGGGELNSIALKEYVVVNVNTTSIDSDQIKK